jgi:anaerobic selenocysteine-containing dehydrogenase
MVWGSNLFQTNEEGIIGSQLRQAVDQGAKLIVIDPRKTGIASRADLWLQPRPGSDLALALGMLRVMIDEGLYEKTFVENWTKGFPELVNHLQQYPLDRVSEITWISKEQIVKTLTLSKTKLACIRGNALNITSTVCSVRGRY